MADDRPVIVRTSASAKDFWCRPRPGERPEPEISTIVPTPQVESGLGHALLASRALTPFGRQKRPCCGDPPPPPPSPINPLNTSRAVQMHLLRQEIERAESNAMAMENLRKQLGRAWTVNHALTGELKKQAVARH